MKAKVRFWGLDVHAETIAVAVAEADGEVRSLGTITNRAESVRKLVKKPRLLCYLLRALYEGRFPGARSPCVKVIICLLPITRMHAESAFDLQRQS